MPQLPVLIALAAVAGVLATIRNPAGRSLVPVLVAPADHAPANALLGLAHTLQLAVGPVLGGLLAAGPGGFHTALAADAVTSVASALLLTRLGAGLAYAVGGLLVDLVGARGTFILAGAGTIAILPILVRTLRGQPHSDPVCPTG